MLVILCGPTGVGRTTISKQLREMCGWEHLKWVTTREKRNFDDRVFLSPNEFAVKKGNGDFFYDSIFENANYGLEKRYLIEAIDDERIWVTDVLPSTIDYFLSLKCVIVLIVPDSEKSLLLQISEAGRSERSNRAIQELNLLKNIYLEHPRIDYIQVNVYADLERTINDLVNLDVKKLLADRFGAK